MTREAIKKLKDILAEATENDDSVCYVTSNDADILKAAIKALEQDPCEDAISRQYLLDNCVVDKVTMPYVPVNKIENAPSITPQPKTGHWIERHNVYGVAFCSECSFELRINNTNYCPNCGARMEGQL